MQREDRIQRLDTAYGQKQSAEQASVPVGVGEIMAARERRACRQYALLQQYGLPLVSFTMNIPGPAKMSADILAAAHEGRKMLEAALENAGVSVLHREENADRCGFEAFYVVSLPPEDLKKITVSIEESAPACRLFDMDVLRSSGAKVERSELGLPPRRCLLCGKDAMVCGRARNHSIEELTTRVEELLHELLRR